jgi:hypothetical protein
VEKHRLTLQIHQIKKGGVHYLEIFLKVNKIKAFQVRWFQKSPTNAVIVIPGVSRKQKISYK